MRIPLLAFTAIIVATTLAPASASADADLLEVSTTQTHVGTAFTVTGNFCPNTGPAPTITYTTRTSHPKAPVMTLPLSNESVSLAQTPSGFTFTYTPPTAKTWVWFDVTCDGASASTSDTPVIVYPLFGEHWFVSPYDSLTGDPGSTVPVTVFTMDCDAASTATLSLVVNGVGGAVVASTTATVTAGVIEFSLDIPAATVPGTNYSAFVDCPSLGHGNLRSGDPFTVLGAAPEPPTIPATGPSPYAGAIAGIGGAFLVLGLVLRHLTTLRA